MSDAPERIWLQDNGDYASAHEARIGTDLGITWCDTLVDDEDTEYVRADLAKPKVKPLVWERTVSMGEVWEAQSIFGEYIVGIDNDGISYGGGIPNANAWVDYSSLEAAKSAAQADYERRILEALE